VTEEADWRFITANYASQEKFLLEENLNKRKIDQDNLFYINLNHADLCDNLICDVYMDYAGMERTNFASCIIHSSTFNFSYLHAANFHKCIIRDSSFYHANLTDADFSGATLTNVNLTNCQLMGANFKKAKLVNVTFFSNINFSDISNMNVVFNMLTGFTKYQANNGFDVLKTAILDDFLRQVASINNLNTQKIWLNLALKNYFFGTHQTGPLESCNRFFYDKNQLADANLIYTASQRTLRTVLRQVLIDIEQAQLTAPIDLRCEPILLHH